jgi:hypothetical protein
MISHVVFRENAQRRGGNPQWRSVVLCHAAHRSVAYPTAYVEFQPRLSCGLLWQCWGPLLATGLAQPSPRRVIEFSSLGVRWP